MDFKKCSEVYGYKSIAEVEKEELAEKIAQRDRNWIKAMINLGDSNEKSQQFPTTLKKLSRKSGNLRNFT